MNHLRTLSFLLGIFFLSTVKFTLSAQYVQNAYVQPVPTTCVDEIFIYIEGWLPNPCWELTGITYSIVGNTVNVTVTAQYNDPGPGNYCIQLLIPWEDYIGIGKLPPGTYNLNVNDFSTTFVVTGTGNCVEPGIIDPGKNCPGTFPVCGCNGVTYVNACTAFYKNGVTSWTLGACPDPCSGNPVNATISGNNTVCSGSNTTLTVAASGGQSPYTYNWSTNEMTPSISPSPAVNTTYTVTVTANNACTATASRAVTVTPAVQITGVTSNGLSGTFQLQGGQPQQNGSNYASVTMTLQGNPGVTATLSTAPFMHNETVSFTCPQAGTYQVVVTDGAGCSGVGTVAVTGSGGGGGQDTVPPCIEWQRTIGGSGSDDSFSIQSTDDGGFIVVGTTDSNDGDVSGNNGYKDFWVVKLTSTGTIQWQKTLGGSDTDAAKSAQQTSDGGFVVAGLTYSNDGNVSGNNGLMDFWVAKLSPTGDLQWQKTLGGSSYDEAQSILQTNDGGYVVVGSTYSNDGDVSGNHGNYDFWVVKLTSTGVIQWQKTLGGSGNDFAQTVKQTKDGGLILTGNSGSSDYDVSLNYGMRDFWVVKLTSTGVIQWQKTLGGSNNDYGWDIQQTSDDGFIVEGITWSNDGNVSGNQGNCDIWVVKITTTGVIQWQKTLGGSNNDYGRSVYQTVDGGYVIAGTTESDDGDISENNGSGDFWVVKLTATGAMQWQKTLGGSFNDLAEAIQQTNDGGFIVTGSARSSDYDVSGNHGLDDFWVVKLGTCPPCTTVTTTAASGPGSLRAALDCANTNPGPDTIRFNIPGPGPHTILLDGSPLAFTDDNTVLDATTQPGWYLGNITVQNNSVPSGQAGMYINANGTRIYGLSVRGFSYGIGMDATDCAIGDYGKGNHIVGGSTDPNSGIIVWSGSDIAIRGNVVGLNTAATMPEGALECCAIGLSGTGASNVRIEGNHLGSNPADRSQAGVDLRGSDISVLGNIIGTDSSGTADFGFIRGINAWSAGVTDVWIADNTIAHSDTSGIRLIASAQRVKMSRNSLFCNQEYGIFLNPDVNGGILPPVILTVTSSAINGSAAPFDTIEVFRSGNAVCPGAACQGRDYLGTTVANSAGNWSLAAPFALPLNAGDQVTATATANQNNTSAFAQCRTQSLPCTDDSLALVALYNATAGPTWINKTNWLQPNQPISTWYGVHTNPNGCVDTLLLDGNNLQNSLPAELGDLSSLQRLLLSNNNLTSSIPKELGRLSTLTELNLSRNPLLSGPIPDSLQNLSNLEGLYLNQTGLSGPIPNWLGDLSNLRFVNLSVMPNLGGAIPAALGNLTALQKLYLNNSGLTGGLPGNINNLGNLNLLNVSGNQLDQTLPAMSGMTALDSFFINQNRFTFEDFRPQIPFFNSLNRFLYSVQDSVYADTTIALNAGQPLVLDLGFDASINDNTYNWEKDGQPLTTITGNNKLIFSSLKKSDEGIYYVGVNNAAAPDLTLFSRAIRLQVICNNPPVPAIEGPSALCDGSATLVVSGAYPTLPEWSTSENAQFITTTSSGLYTVTVTDANGCTGSATRNIGPNAASPVPEIDGPTALCDGFAALTVIGTYPVLPQWSTNESGQSIIASTPGLYSVTVTDANGCTGTTEQNIGPNVTSPVPGIEGPITLCDGSATLTVSGTYPVSPQWSTNENGQSITVTIPGPYSVTVTDTNGCTGTATQNIGPNTASPVPEIDGPTALCDGTATLTVSGIYPILPQWSTNENAQSITTTISGLYVVTVTDANGCTGTAAQNVGGFASSPQPDVTGPTALCSGSVMLTVSGAYPEAPQWSNGQTGYSISVSAPGNYTVTVKDANGCTATDEHVVSNQGAPATTATSTPAGCNQTNGSINLTVTGGTPGYSYLWNTGATLEDLSNLGVGAYTVTVTDAAQCTATATATVSNPNAPDASAVPGLSDCDQPTGSIDLTVTGGTPGYTYEWSNGATVQDPSGLAAGAYTVTVTDAANCSTITGATVLNPPSPVANAVSTPAGCGQSNGGITLTVSGGTPGYTYLWSNGDTNQNPENIPAGAYTVTVTDQAGCTTTTATAVTNPNAPIVSTQTTNATCGLPNGSVNLDVNGGTPPYQYLWSNGSTAEDLTGVEAGMYTVTVTDAANCSQVSAATVEGPLPLANGAVQKDCDAGNAFYTVSFPISGGTTPYVLLSGGGTIAGNIFTSQPIASGGSYVFNISDAAGCPPLVISGSHECDCVADAGAMNTAIPLKACGADTISADHNLNQLFVPPGAILLYVLHKGNGAALINPIDWNAAPLFHYVPGIVYGETYYISAVVGQQSSPGIINVNDPCLSVAPGTPVVFLQESEIEVNAVICKGDQYQLGSDVFTTPGSYTGILENSVGCDSIVHLNLDVRDPVVGLGDDKTVCINTKLTLHAEISGCLGCTYQWSETGLQGPQVMVQPAATTTYKLTITDNAGCTAQADIQVNVEEPVNSKVEAAICEGGEYHIAGKTFDKAGEYDIIQISDAGCADTTRLILEVLDARHYVAVPDTFFCPPGQGPVEHIFAPANNDTIVPGASWRIALLDAPVAGVAEVTQDSQALRYRLTDLSFRGLDAVTYELCDAECSGVCSSARVYIVVQDDIEKVANDLPNGFTPNGDGINDFFNPLQNYLDQNYIVPLGRVSLTIINRWGEIVYQANPYQYFNELEGGWDGRNGNGSAVVPGTYYYMLRLDVGETVVIKGAVQVLTD